jgi:8-oxo-dGTP pyrophosphatase MutT (NUDIX family)
MPLEVAGLPGHLEQPCTPREEMSEESRQMGGDRGEHRPAPPIATPERRFHQVVPRPAEVAPGSPPPWLMRGGRPVLPLATQIIRDAIDPLDDAALLEHSPRAAVLVAILERHGVLSVVLTRRSSRLTLDPGNVSFPGGRLEEGELPRAAAVREAEEEIGLDPAAVEVIGTLGPIERVRDGQRVASVVGLVHGDPLLVANEDEVAAILEVPLEALLEPGAAWEEHWGDRAHPVRFFAHPEALGANLVWGLTARVLWDLLDRLTRRDG